MEKNNFKDMLIAYRRRYLYEPRIDIMRYLSKNLKECLDKLEIEIEDRLYTEYDYDLIDEKILDYYTDGTFKPIKSLCERGVSEEEYKSILEALSKIVQDYNL